MRPARPLSVAFYVVAWVFLAGAMGELMALSSSTMNSGFDLRDLDTTCKPCADFYQYATGGWRKLNPVPPSTSSWGQFNALEDKNQAILRQILEAAASDRHAAPGSIEQKIGDFYASCMDEKRVNAAGAKPLATELKRIDAIASLADLQSEVTQLQSIGVDAMFGFGSEPDF